MRERLACAVAISLFGRPLVVGPANSHHCTKLVNIGKKSPQQNGDASGITFNDMAAHLEDDSDPMYSLLAGTYRRAPRARPTG